MIENKHKEIARWAMEFALKNGCNASRVSVVTGQNNSIEYRNTQLDKLQQSSENKLFIEFFVNGRYGSFSTNRIEKAELEMSIKNGIASTRFLAEDIFRQLPHSDRYYKATKDDDLDLFDASYYDYTIDQKLDLARATVEEVYQTDSRIVSVMASFDDGCGSEYFVASNGFEGESRDSAFSLTAEVALKTESDARPESYWYDSRVYFSDLQKSGIAKKALGRAIRKIGQKKIKSGRYTMLLDNTVSLRLFAPLVSAMYGSALQQKSSFLINRLGQQVVSDKLTVIDDPHIHRAFGSRWFDGEGVATKRQTIINKGVLDMYFIDTYHSLKMNTEPTISSPSVISAELGTRNFTELLQSLNKGIWITGFNGGNTNSTTGDFSFGIEGYLVENGVATQPVSEMNITGNMLQLWQNLMEIGCDPRDNSSWRFPSMVFDDINFSGL
ncbi:PmbA protein [Dysgonomonas sp. PH5-45]|uniref:TldD/PmbA family protein n=1 Tax=unclassified Dysgonomonas TaxID=2630389 RepID=UPI0024747161|nr:MULTISPECIES: TldD/PmbA family protein [unclassified Dysgonomonas]MDH6354330.1 PmbA protein [Dysgonomonas sp. PH5-45]MDH6387230.1 PmbA protein [Dysgonomonas sp. PH5-37]